MSDSMILFSKANGVATITFNRPKANAYNLDFYSQFYDAVIEADQDSEVNVVIINSSSEKFFCAGADIKEFAENSTEQNQVMVAKAQATMAAIENSGKIFIAEIAGHALGGGMEIIMTCDLRFAAEGSYLLGLPEIKLGLIPGNGGSQRLTRLVGMSRAIELLASGDPFSITDAEKYGLINRLYPREELAEATMTYAKNVAKGPGLALAATKRAVRIGGEKTLAEGLLVEKEQCDALYDTEDAAEGFKAFIEKREPIFKGQ